MEKTRLLKVSNKKSGATGSAQLSRMALNDNKAGMQGLDKDKINQIIMDNTVGSRFYMNEQKREMQVNERITKMKEKLNSFSTTQILAAKQQADDLLTEIEKQRDLTRTIIHIDMDAFYASVEERDRPELKTKPMAVGGMDMLSTSNYVARKYGVRAAMPGFIAKKLCPELVIVPLNFDKYKQVSKQTQEIFAEYDANFSGMSLDEAFLDITDHLQKRILYDEEERTFHYHHSLAVKQPQDSDSDLSRNVSETFGFSPEDVANELRFRIHQKTLLTASAGIAPNTMLAKIGSDLNKPNGQTYFKPNREEILKFVKDFPVRKVNGVGKVTEQLLSALDIKKCGDLYERRGDLVLLFSEISCSFFFRISLGCSSNVLESSGERKSISTERTFNAISEHKELFAKLEELCQSLAVDMEKENLQGKTLTLKTKNVNFQLHTRSKTVTSPLFNFESIFAVAQKLLEQEIMNANNKLTLRLMGVGLSKFETQTTSGQTSIRNFFSDRGFKKQESRATSVKSVTKHTNELDKSENELNSPRLSSNNYDTDNEVTGLENRQSGGSTEIQTLFSCPVCLVDNFSNITLLNQHLDKCLSSTEDKIGTGHAQDCTVNVGNNTDPSVQESCSKKPYTTVENSIKPVSENETQIFICPICNKSFDASNTSLHQFNCHMDTCLSHGAIRDLLKADNEDSFKRPCPNNNFNENISKRRKVVSKIKPKQGIIKFFER